MRLYLIHKPYQKMDSRTQSEELHVAPSPVNQEPEPTLVQWVNPHHILEHNQGG